MGLLDKLLNHDDTVSTGATSSRNVNACPYCGTIFEKPPKKKTICQHCNKPVYIRTKQVLFDSDLLTEEDALASDFFTQLEYLGAKVDDYRKIESKLAKKWKTKPHSYDIVWGLSNHMMITPMGNSSDTATLWQQSKMVSFQQGLYQLKRGKDPVVYQQISKKFDVQIGQMQNLVGLNDKIGILTNGCCDSCEKHKSEKYTVAEINNSTILPFKDCTKKLNKGDKYSWCVCLYDVLGAYTKIH